MTVRQYPFSQVDAFTLIPLAGNPCAIVFEADDLTPNEMLKIAKEMNLSETSFVMKSSIADFRFRYFTPAEELPLAGHPTIATVHSVIERKLVPDSCKSLKIELLAGVIEVEIARTKDLAVQITMSQLKPKFMQTYPAKETLGFFSLSESDLLNGYEVQTVSTGTPMLMIPLVDKRSLERIRFKANEFAEWKQGKDFYSVHLFCLDGFTSDGATASRHFCPPPDVIEDPFTGSATGAMACYLWKHDILRKNSFIAEQGYLMGRPGQAFVKISGTGESIDSIQVGGSAVTVLTGHLFL